MNGNRAPRAPRPLLGEKPPYKLCWQCNRPFQGGRGRPLVVHGQTVWVHSACFDDAKAAP